jgi:integrase
MSSAPQRFSVYRGDLSGEVPPTDHPTLSWTLCQVYERYLLPVCRRSAADPRSSGTIAKDRHALGWWSRLTHDPPLGQVSQPICNAFCERLAAAEARGKRPLALGTRHDVIRALQLLLDLCGPRSRRRPKALGLWQEPPWLECPPMGEPKVEDIWRLDELALLLEATAVTRRPEWWQALFLFLYNTGQRIGATMRASWENVDRKEPGWLWLPRETMKGGKRSHHIPLNRPARESIELVRRDGEPLLFGRLWPAAKSAMERTLNRIKTTSGLPPHRCQGFAFHAVRGCCSTEGYKLNYPGTELLLAHRGVSVGIDCYAGRELMLEVVNHLPQPPFERQKRLF